MLYEILLIVVCMFASIGIVEVAISIFNHKCSKRLPHKFAIKLENVKSEQAEYIIRYIEELLWISGADAAIGDIILEDSFEIDDDVLASLRCEFRNLKRKTNTVKEFEVD